MADEDPRAKYRKLPPNIDRDDWVIEVETREPDLEKEADYNNGADPYLRITGWKPPG